MRSSRLRASLAGAFVVLPLLGACGSDEPTPAAAGADPTSTSAAPASTSAAPAAGSGGGTTADPCSLLTAAEVSAAVGGTVKDGTKAGPDGPLGLVTCIWSTGSGVVPVRTFQIGISTDEGITVDGYSAAKLYDDTVKQLGATPAGGIGDKAAFSNAMGYVLRGDVFMTTSVGFGTSDTAKAALKNLTTKAAGKL